MSLRDSKYAPKTPIERLAISKAEKLKQDKAKLTRLLKRLLWKAESLVGSYRRAAEIQYAEATHDDAFSMQIERQYAFMRGTDSKQAEAMFKVDFFEFYTLLERFITISLDIMGIHVSGNTSHINFNPLAYITNPDLHRTKPVPWHAFHANLLEALDDEACPLHASLGNQEVRVQLGLAKDYRNAWKDADETVSKTSSYSGATNSAKNVRLVDLDLNKMLNLLLTGCEHAHGVVQARPDADLTKVKSQDFETLESYNVMDMADIPYEFMDDAMDLD